MIDAEALPADAGLPVEAIDHLELRDKRVFLRLDLSVGEGLDTVQALERGIERALPTLQYAREQGARLVLASHQGRPGTEQKASLEAVASALAQRLGVEIYLPDDCIGDAAKQVLNQLRPGQVCLLENLARHAEEATADPVFASKLAAQIDVFVNDAPSLLHESWTSLCTVPGLVRQRALGLVCAAELRQLVPLRAPGRLQALVACSDDSEQLEEWCTSFAVRTNTLLLAGKAAAQLQRELRGVGMSGSEGQAARSLLRRLEAVRCSWWVLDPADDGGQAPVQHVLPRTAALEALGRQGQVLALCTSSGAGQLLPPLTQAAQVGLSVTVLGWADAEHLSVAASTQAGLFFSQAGENALRFLSGRRLPALAALSPNVRD